MSTSEGEQDGQEGRESAGTRSSEAGDDGRGLGDADPHRARSEVGGSRDAEERAESTGTGPDPEVLSGLGHSPLFHAQQELRYIRQALIGQYEQAFRCRLIVLNDMIFGYSVTLCEELLHGADAKTDLHLLLNTPGGDGEVAVRLARSMQSRCKHFTVIVPDVAKSAGTLLALGAHRILMGPASDLGPVDPQMQLKPGVLVSAKDIIASVEDAARRVQELPQTYPIYASLLTDVTAITVQ